MGGWVGEWVGGWVGGCMCACARQGRSLRLCEQVCMFAEDVRKCQKRPNTEKKDKIYRQACLWKKHACLLNCHLSHSQMCEMCENVHTH